MRRGRRGFTLVEVLLVVVILGLLALIAIPRFAHSGSQAKVNACKANIVLLNKQIELYRADYCEDIPDQTIFEHVVLNYLGMFPDGPPECPFGDPYVFVADKQRVVPHNH
jgi:prepilin-type N-terminal cleavage/methylation domain-containing protein